VIQFHGDSLVPPELCRLLYVTVPDELHVPVTFHNRPTIDVPEGAIAACTDANRIDVDVNDIFYETGRRLAKEAISVGLWRRLLEICYHEFGHVATWPEALACAPYSTDQGKADVEGLADRWMNQRMAILLDHDPRLEQPRLLKGYIGARISRLMDQLMSASEGGSRKNAYVKEVRSRRTGGQLSSGDVLRHLGVSESAYRELRRVSADIGIDYVDSAGRKHKWYVWGDLRLLESRLKKVKKGLPEGGQVRLSNWWWN
jgi:hypothetical protein